MIWFACSQCGKHFSRPETCCGMLVFCDQCGHGNRVPWESTVPPPEPAEVLPVMLPAEPASPAREVIPLPEPEAASAASSSPAAPAPVALPQPAAPRRREPDPRFCLNHPEVPAEVTCADCQERFCKHCVLEWHGRPVCGPCKNYYFWQQSQRPRRSRLALAALLLSLGASLVPGLWAFHHLERFLLPVVFITELVPQLLAALLALLVLRRTWHDPRPIGQSLALSALLAALANSLLLVLLTSLRLVEWL